MRKHRAQSFGALNAFEKPDRRSKGAKGRAPRKSWGEDGPQLPWSGLSMLSRSSEVRKTSRGGPSSGGPRPASPALSLSSSVTSGAGLDSLTLRVAQPPKLAGSIAEEGEVGTPGSRASEDSINSAGSL